MATRSSSRSRSRPSRPKAEPTARALDEALAALERWTAQLPPSPAFSDPPQRLTEALRFLNSTLRAAEQRRGETRLPWFAIPLA